MKKKIKIIKIVNILLILVWMATIFGFSKEEGESSSGTSRYVTEVMVDAFTNEEISTKEKEDIIENLQPVVRKCAHYTIYLIGGLLFINLFNTYNLSEKQKIIYSLILAIIYACTDEIHQYFVPGRSAKVIDVFIDSLGVLTGIVFFYIAKKVVQSIKDRQLVVK